jgi:hypothetical protein
VCFSPQASEGPWFLPARGRHPESSDIVDSGPNELGLLNYPRVPPLLPSWRQVDGGTELMCSRVVAASLLMKETLAMVGRDVLHLTWVSPKTEGKIFT